MARVMGLDGGGTKTDAVVVDMDGHVIARKRTDGLDPMAGSAWKATLSGIAAELGPFTASVLGLPYHGEMVEISAEQSALATKLFGPQSIVLNDVAVAFEGALAGAGGVLVLAGTGSMAWSRGPLGQHRVGGWGDIFGDEGSAFWIGREALARVSEQLDGRSAATGFATAVLERLSIGAAELIGWTYGLKNPRARIASLAAFVSELADAGSADARAIMTAAGVHLGRHGLTAARLCGASDPASWSFAGSVMKDRTVRDALINAMGSAPVSPVLSPVGGAVLAAARAAGWRTSRDFIETLRAELSE